MISFYLLLLPASLARMSRLFRALCPLLLSVSMLAAQTAASENLREAANRSGSFKTFLSAAKTAGVLDELQSRQALTLFLPTDTAFSQLPDGEWEAIVRDKARLSRVIRYHMVRGRMKVTEVKPGPIKTLEGSDLHLKSDNGMVTVNGARVTESDVVADNGIIHGIDKVLVPPEEN